MSEQAAQNNQTATIFVVTDNPSYAGVPREEKGETNKQRLAERCLSLSALVVPVSALVVAVVLVVQSKSEYYCNETVSQVRPLLIQFCATK